VGREPTVTDLAAVPPTELVAATNAISAEMISYADRWGPVAHTPTPFSPVVDGDVLPQAPWAALTAGAGRDVELIVGHNSDEYRLFLVMNGQLGKLTEDDATRALAVFAPSPAAYRKAFPCASAGDLFELVQSDWLFRMPSHRLAEAQVAGGGRAYAYELTWPAPGMGGVFGATHGLDIPLVFGNLTAGTVAAALIGTEPSGAEAVSRQMRSAWTAFATTGDPGWPRYDGEGRLVALFDTEMTVGVYPEETSRGLWAAHEFAALPLLGE
jgi:para-nitrobenzyl esterase